MGTNGRFGPIMDGVDTKCPSSADTIPECWEGDGCLSALIGDDGSWSGFGPGLSEFV